KPGAEIPRATDVQDLVVSVPEEVDTGAGRRAEGERALEVDPAGARRGELAKVGDARRAALLCEPDERDEDLGGRGRVRQRAVAGSRARAEEVRERGEARP